MSTEQEKSFPPSDPSREKFLIDALIDSTSKDPKIAMEAKRDFRLAGGGIIDGFSKEETLARLKEKKDAGKYDDVRRDADFLRADENIDTPSSDEIVAFMGKIHEHVADESKSFLTNAYRYSTVAFYYRILSKEYPQLGVSVQEEAFMPDTNELIPGDISVHTTPYRTDRHLVFNLDQGNPVLYFLEFPDKEKLPLIEKLEAEGKLPKGTGKRTLMRKYADYVKQYPNDDLWTNLYSEMSRSLGVDPLSDEELHALLKAEIDRELDKRGYKNSGA